MTVWDKQRDRALLKAMGRGDENAFWTLYDRHAGLLAVRLARRGATPAEIEEVLQETFLASWRGAKSYRSDGAPGAWLWGIAQRQYAQLIRREVSNRRTPPEQAVAVNPESAWVDHLAAAELVERLDPQLRATFDAVTVQGMSVAQAADHLGIPEGTIKSRMHRVRRLIDEESL